MVSNSPGSSVLLQQPRQTKTSSLLILPSSKKSELRIPPASKSSAVVTLPACGFIYCRVSSQPSMRFKGSSFRGTQVSASGMKISNQFAQFEFLSFYPIFLGVLGKVGRDSAPESHTQPHTALRTWLAETTECNHESMTLEPPQNKGQIITMVVYGDL